MTNVSLSLTIPGCSSCGRWEEPGPTFIIEDDIKPILIHVGLYSGEPTSEFDLETTAMKMSERLISVRTKLLEEAYGYMGQIQKIKHGRRGGYESLIDDMSRFIDACQRYPNAVLTITTH